MIVNFTGKYGIIYCKLCFRVRFLAYFFIDQLNNT